MKPTNDELISLFKLDDKIYSMFAKYQLQGRLDVLEHLYKEFKEQDVFIPQLLEEIKKLKEALKEK